MKDRYNAVRAFTESLCDSLAIEDYGVQSMPDASPTKWHLAHTTWFFETFVLKPHRPDWRSPHPLYEVLFNSYYNAVGEQWSRRDRGKLSRPTVAEVFAYRSVVDEAVRALIDDGTAPLDILELGLNHEQQHQELLLTDIKHAFALNPLRPVFREGAAAPVLPGRPARWRRFGAGLRGVGFSGGDFAYDNEGPAHRTFVEEFEISDRLVTNGEWLEFMADDGYRTPSLWLSEGWHHVNDAGWQAPLYWERSDDSWVQMTLGGLRDVDPHAAVTHVSLFEADAFASWAGARLPTEFEWEVAAAEADAPSVGAFVDGGRLHPGSATSDQFFGDVWEWTRSAYGPYPGFRAGDGALGEYNGKFMCNQNVLRGGSCATSLNHIRRTYRNFFGAHARWQFSGVRLARA